MPLSLTVALLVSCAGGVPARTSGASAPPVIRPGTPVRLQLQGEGPPLEGRLLSQSAQTLVVKVPTEKERHSIDAQTVETIEVARRQTLAGLGAGVVTGAAAGAALSVNTGEGIGSDALLGGLLGLPAAAAGVAVGGGEHPATAGALAGAAVDGVLLGVVLGGWCTSWNPGHGSSCVAETALLGAGFGAASGGVAAYVSRRHWTPVWARRAAVGIGPTKGRGAALVVRLAF